MPDRTGFWAQMEDFFEGISSNLKLVDKALSGLEGSYVELLTILALGLLAVIPVVAPERRRQAIRHATQVFGIVVFIFVVFTCLGVFGMIRNMFRGLEEIGRENIVALYYCSVPVTVLVTSLLFGPTFCGWICPTGALQEFVGMITARWTRSRKKEGWPFSWGLLVTTTTVVGIFLLWMAYLANTRIFFVEDASIYWSEVLILVLVLLVFGMRKWDARLRRLRILSFAIILVGAIVGLRITSPVHFGFSKIYDPASLLATVMVILAALVVPQIWCRYLCPWREAIAWAGKSSVRKLVTDFSACSACGTCTEGCPVDAVTEGKIDPHECHMCLKCVDHCPTRAIRVVEDWRSCR